MPNSLHALLLPQSALNVSWWQGRGSNPRPKAYESSALPLSYPAKLLITKDLGLKSCSCLHMFSTLEGSNP
jgi:hypothetical protein